MTARQQQWVRFQQTWKRYKRIISQNNILYLFEYKSHFFIPENQSKNGGATYTRCYVKVPAKITTYTYENM